MPPTVLASQPLRRSIASRANMHIYRQIEALAQYFNILSRYMGDVAFEKLAASAIGEDATALPSLRKDCESMLRQLQNDFSSQFLPELRELAHLQTAMYKAFEASEQPTLTIGHISPMSDQQINQLHFVVHSSVQLLQFNQNTSSLWAALTCGESPPKPHRLDEPQHIVVWRQLDVARYRILGSAEAAALRVLKLGHKLAAVQSLLNTLEGEGRCARNYFEGWVAAGMVLIPMPDPAK
jgi:hypothetical protein